MATATGTCLGCPDRVERVVPQASLAVRIADTLGEWLRRARSRRLLAQMDERMLHDIGLTRDAALSEGDKPFWRA
jgi:uncharacterized protein YjiS (DUF1127 family)